MSPEQTKAIIKAIARADVPLLEKTKTDIARKAIVFTKVDSFLMALYRHAMRTKPGSPFPEYDLSLGIEEKRKLDRFCERFSPNRTSILNSKY